MDRAGTVGKEQVEHHLPALHNLRRWQLGDQP